MRFLYDESHNQTWTIDPARAVQLSRRTNEAPRYYSYAHVAELVRTLFDGTVERLAGGPLTRERLAGADLLLINHCCLSGHQHLGVGGEAIFDGAEIAAVEAAVEAGMGLLVLGEFEIDSWGSNVNALLRPFGMRFNHDVAAVPARGVRGPLRLPVFETAAIVPHPATAAVRKISYGAGCTLALLDRRAAALVTAEDGAPLLAAAAIGRGRVVAAGDSDLFAEPFVFYNDNRALLVGLLSWLSGKAAATPVASAACEQTAHELVAHGLAQAGQPAPGTVIDLDGETSERARQLLAAVTIDPHADFEAFAFEAKLAFHELPQRLRRVLVEFAHRGNIDGTLLLRGLPQDPVIPPTPSRTGERVRKATHASELWLCATAAALGEPVGYLQEKQGSIFQDVFPTAVHADKLSSESSSILLDFHTEIAFHPFMPDYILLYGLRQDPERQARTIFASVRRFFHLLAPADKDTLFSNLFRTGIDYSFGNTGQQAGAGPLVSVLYGDRLDPYLRYDLDLMVGQTPAARRALELVRELVNDVKREVAIEPGSLLVIDNRRAVHARSTFKASFDGRDRWLQRLAVVRDLDASLHDRMRGTRVIATDFSSYLAARAADGDAG
jgi:Taurine catabolism dioxygenase TauD, TfdA family